MKNAFPNAAPAAALLSLLGMGNSAHAATLDTASEPDWKLRCKALAHADVSGIADAPTQITSANPVDATDSSVAHCEVQGYVSPQVGFKLGLPAIDWNKKFLQLGCGGDCGYLAESRCRAPLQKGYACIVFDAGHAGSGGVWALNNLQALVDFGYRGAHVAAVAGKAITERHYRQAPNYSYFAGCSTGGRQALILAQRFPFDFDGIISGAPWIDDSDSAMYYVWANRVLSDKEGKSLLSRDHLRLVHNAVLAKCEMDDGVKDGVIGNPAACDFDPKVLVCKNGASANCLTEVQADAVRKVYEGPKNSKGERLYVGGAARGSELVWNYFGGSEIWALLHFRYMVMPAPGPTWQLSDFDFDRDPARFSSGTQESLLNASNPDLRKFKAAGGKLLIYQGWNDTDDLPARTIDYYETVERTMGGPAATRDFARLFMISGMNHCSGGRWSICDRLPERAGELG